MIMKYDTNCWQLRRIFYIYID